MFQEDDLEISFKEEDMVPKPVFQGPECRVVPEHLKVVSPRMKPPTTRSAIKKEQQPQKV